MELIAKAEIIEQLEKIIDKYSIAYVLNSIAMIAWEKGDHAIGSWQEPKLGRKWVNLGDSLEGLADRNDI